MTSFFLNGKPVNVDEDPSTPLLWVIRDSLGLTGTKFGCGMALCGACTIHLDGRAIRSCVAPLSRAAGKHVTTTGGRSLQQLLEHVSTDDLVGWGWDPGAGRTRPPLSRADTVAQLRIWIDGGAACPP